MLGEKSCGEEIQVPTTINGREVRIGLALSGGGFRAAAFHLGMMRRLHQFNLLAGIDLLTCVSGGSIAGATLAANWSSGVEAALDKLDVYLRTKSIAVASVIGGIVDPFASRLDKLARNYDRDLFNKRKLRDLQNCPRIYLNATNLATGNMFFFVSGGTAGDKAEMGEYELGVVAAPDFDLCYAVAASSAFPPVFGPMRIDTDAYPPGDPVGYVTLTDGGVYDNLGINPGLRVERNKLDYLIASDGGKPFTNTIDPTQLGAGVIAASLDIMMEQVRGLQFDRMQHRHMAGKGPKPIWFSIDSTVGQAKDGDATFASSIGTNLARLNNDEMTVLQRHGAALVEARLKAYAPELMP
jgi:NTE family protein